MNMFARAVSTCYNLIRDHLLSAETSYGKIANNLSFVRVISQGKSSSKKSQGFCQGILSAVQRALWDRLRQLKCIRGVN